MNKTKLKTYHEIQKQSFTTSEVIQSSFTNVFKTLKKYEYALVNNYRQKKSLVITTIDNYLNQEEITSGKLEGTKKAKLKQIIRNKIKENVFYLMRFESPNITFPEVESIIDKAKLNKKYDFDVQLTNQLLAAWKFILKTIEVCSLPFLLRLNSIIAKNQALEWGTLRKGEVTISGTNYVPSLPSKEKIKQIINLEEKNIVKKACLMLVKLIKQQPFWDGNKRTAFLFVNKFLLDNSKGTLIVNENNLLIFNKLLNSYYNNQNKEEQLVVFLLAKCFVPF